MKLTKGGTVFDQREVILIPFPYSDLTGAKKRPALIVSNDKLSLSEDRICCLITSNETKEGLLLDEYEEGKLPLKSWVKPHRLFTVHKHIIIKKMCKIKPGLYKKIVRKISEYIE